MSQKLLSIELSSVNLGFRRHVFVLSRVQFAPGQPGPDFLGQSLRAVELSAYCSVKNFAILRNLS